MPITIKSELNAASAPGTLKGQVVEFAAGAIPEGFTQVAGPIQPLQPDTGLIAITNAQAKTGYASSRFVAAGGRLFAAGVSGSNWQITELAADYSKVGSPVAVPSLNASYPIFLINLSNGKLLRVGGDSSTPASGQTQVYDPLTGSIAQLASKPGNDATPPYIKASQAGDGVVYGVFTQASDSVSSYNPTTNTWAVGVATAPATASSTLAVEKLPSGNLFWCTATAQYIFNHATKQFTQIGSYAFGGSVAALPTDKGVRIYRPEAASIDFYEYTEQSNSFVYALTDAPKLASPNTTSAPSNGYSACTNPYTGATVFKSVHGNKADVAYQHLLNYTPVGSVKAVKL